MLLDDDLQFCENRLAYPGPTFRSDGQARPLSELYLSGETELSLTDLAKRTGLAYRSIHREVARLIESGMLVERRSGRTRLVQPNLTSPVMPLLAGTLERVRN